MAMNVNLLVFGGNLTKDPELRYTASGKAVASFTVASNRSWKQGEEWKEDTTFLRISVWGKAAENAAANLNKGSPVVCEGYLKESKWEDDVGNKRSRLEMSANRLHYTKTQQRQSSNDYPPGHDDDIPF